MNEYIPFVVVVRPVERELMVPVRVLVPILRITASNKSMQYLVLYIKKL